MKPQPMINNTMIHMIRLEQMLQRPCSFLRARFDIMNLDGGQIDGGVIRALTAAEKREFERRQLKHFDVLGEMVRMTMKGSLRGLE